MNTLTQLYLHMCYIDDFAADNMHACGLIQLTLWYGGNISSRFSNNSEVNICIIDVTSVTMLLLLYLSLSRIAQMVGIRGKRSALHGPRI